jgi:octaprenyl-diphosphate synthase
MCDYIISAGGKRLRPTLTLLTGHALGQSGPILHQLAAVVEFIHTATLLHDDVVDESTLRRGRETANQRFGNAASVLVGDFLYSRAFQMMVEVGEMRVMEILSDATNVIAEGEVQQLLNMGDASLDEAGYLHVIRSKTAKLFEASARLPAVIANSPPATEQACAAYGQALGTAFQIVDDILDYDGDASVLGKNLGDDLREGKVTLPLIHALKATQGAQRQLLVDAIERESCENLEQVIDVIRRTGAIAAARKTANHEAQLAISAAGRLPESEARSALIHLATTLQERAQ